MQLPDLTKYIPFKVSTTGPKRAVALAVFEHLFPYKKNKLYTIKRENLLIDMKNRNERLLAYFFYNVLRHYKNTPLFQYMKNTLNANSVFIDIGANLGVYSYFAKNMESDVIAFEPDPQHVDFLKRNNDLYNQFFPIALSDADDECEFFVAADANLGGGSLVMSNKGWDASGYTTKVKVKTRRFDDIPLNFDRAKTVKLIKIDVEGAEEQVVKGMVEFLKKQNQCTIWCEVRGPQSDRNPGSFERVIECLRPLNLKPFVYTNNQPYPFSEKHITNVFDLLFLPEGRVCQ